MSVKNNERLIVALDTATIDLAMKLVEEIGDEVSFYKVGLELMMSNDYFQLISWLKDRNKKVFADLKIYDIPETVGKVVHSLSLREIDFLTIHTASHDIMSRAAENKGKMKLLGVTVLTSIDQNDLNNMGFDPEISLSELVIKKTKSALNAGFDGVISSAMEAKTLRENIGNNFDIVTPGIRLEAIPRDDQKRVTDAKTAMQNGSSYLVVGRPITQDQNPKMAARRFHQMMDLSVSI